jgi:hypothetical protein
MSKMGSHDPFENSKKKQVMAKRRGGSQINNLTFDH